MTFSRIDPSLDKQPLIGQIRQILEEGQSHNAAHFTQNSWEWQYEQLPSGQASVYVAREEGTIWSYYHVPIYKGRVLGKTARFAMVQDVAVSERLRGRGVFRSIATHATEDLQQQGIDLAYTFPNTKSIHTFLKYNDYRLIQTLDAYILPVKASAVLDAKLKLGILNKIAGLPVDLYFRFRGANPAAGETIRRHETLSPEILALYEQFTATVPIGITRDRAYLEWRYLAKPHGQHFVLTLERAGRPVAAGIFKIDDLLSVDTLILMDFAYLPGEEAALVTLFSHTARHAERLLGKPVQLAYTSGLSPFYQHLTRAGFLKVPQKLNPRPLNLLGRALAAPFSEAAFQPTNWHITLSDWDVL